MIPGKLIVPGQLTDPGVGERSDNCNCSHEFFVTPGKLAEVTFLHMNKTQKLPRGKSSLAHALY